MSLTRSRSIDGLRPNTLARSLCATLFGGAMTAAGLLTVPAASARVDVGNVSIDPPRPKGGSSRVVTTCEDDLSPTSLRTLLQNAQANDTIDLTHLTCSTITLQHGALASTVSVTIDGPGAGHLSIDAGSASRILSASDYVYLEGLTLKNGGTTDYGGCIFAQHDLTVRDSVLTDCHVTDGVARGGAIRAAGNLLLVNSVVSGSSAVSTTHEAFGGALYVEGTSRLYNATLSNNLCRTGSRVAAGGALFAHAGVIVNESHIEGNIAKSGSAPAYGGAIHTSFAAPIFIQRSVLTDNLAHSESSWSYGGAVSSGRYGSGLPALVGIYYSTLSGNTADSNCASCTVSGGGVHALDSITAMYSTIDHNNATCNIAASACVAGGGGLALFGNQSESSLLLINSTISTNHASGGTAASAGGFGGGIALMSSLDRSIDAVYSTIAFNASSKSGGGVSWHSTTSFMANAIIAQNQTGSGPNDIARGPLGTGAFQIAGSNNIMMTADHATWPADTYQDDPALLPLHDNGGLTETHALEPGSVAIDHGFSVVGFACDQRGSPFARVAGSAPDIGAFEVQDVLFVDGFDGPVPCLGEQ